MLPKWQISWLIVALSGIFLMALDVRAERYDIHIRQAPQKSYEEEEDGKILPTKTFLSTFEILLLCSLFILTILFLGFCMLYLYCFGCRCPGWFKTCCCCGCCRRRKSNDYTQVQLHRDRKIGEIWKTNYPPSGKRPNPV
ncbi:hypothetical protein TCAL_08970 [Tigriopus californicus]|uniref:Uncharacterized protein n=1 Tax=Tigriopus californicus TaxID=6832 RepID=A0A553PMD6_TIGCA|nr:uncharacterized protein LOC131890447 [Tigriopus californicus]TRY78840.1 hypothetical protein TCAL_08970 [Tigriopus californicus]|eukprot:TCALIF_08970-PA protein Name:"Protein of unknown function" AED:0.00 eAED:0.00 QI:632/1/1/1/0.5/0.33/3/200/139